MRSMLAKSLMLLVGAAGVVSLQAHKTPTIKNIGFVVKHQSPEAAQLARDLACFIIGQKGTVIFADESTTLADSFKKTLSSQEQKQVRTVPKEQLPAKTDLIVVLGGDGTLLSIARLMQKKSVPIMGINMGHLGFLTEIKNTEAIPLLEKIMQGTPPLVSERTLLDVTVKRKNKVVLHGSAVNDAIISKGAIARIIGLEVSINNHGSYTVQGDGLIISTPTGSTAYSLSAGGPIVAPYLDAMILTPICPHTLTQRPIVIPDSSIVTVTLIQRPGHVYISLDGQESVNLEEHDVVTITKLKGGGLKLIYSPDRDYFGLLRDKLKFGLRA